MDYLFFTEIIHTLAALAISAYVFYRFGNWKLSVLAILWGVGLDIDHLLDYFIWQQSLSFNLAEFLSGGYYREMAHLSLFLHGWEYPIIILIGQRFLKKKPKNRHIPRILQTIAWTWLAHLIVDQLTNFPPPFAYFITYRLFFGAKIWGC